jgi:uncharacterized protein
METDPKVTLWSAAKANDVGALERLSAEPGVNLDARDPRGFSALMLAAYSGAADSVAFLLAKGVHPDSRDNSGNTVLMGAAFKGDAAIMKQLIAAGADVKATNLAGQDARVFAEMSGRTDVLALI